MSIFVDESPTYGYFPPVYYYMRRVREWLKSEGYGEWYRNYFSIRDKAGEGPLLAEIHKKLGS